MPFSRQVENMIASLRGFPPDRSISKMRESKPVGDLITGVLEKYRVGMPSREDTIMQNWEKIVGPANVGYSHLLRIENERTVFVAVTNQIVRQEMYFHRKLILERIQALPGCKDIRVLMLRAG